MTKNLVVFVDVANLYYAAKSAGVDVDYVTLLKGALRGRDLIRAYAYSGLDPENENQRKFIDFLSKNGYKVVVKDIRKYGDGKIKANLDIELVVDLFRLADRMDVAIVISGDGDFAPALRALQDKGVRAEVISFRGNTSSDLIAVADEFIDIMKVVQVGRTKKDAVVPPEMPAKEVTPEFSFREAPPSVAAAARAALRTGGRPPARSAARRGEPPAVLAVAVGSEAEQLAERGDVPFEEEELVATAGDPREAATRRRRRRGGRGRGRSRGDAAARGEPGADEFDALSELDLAAERDYAFSEADEATLAELGLLQQAAAGARPSARGFAAAAADASDDGDAVMAARAAGESSGEAVSDGEDDGRPRRGRRGGRARTRGSEVAAADATAPADAVSHDTSAAAVSVDATPPTSRRRTPRRSAPAESGETEAAPRTTAGRRSRRSGGTAGEAAAAPADAAPSAEGETAAPRTRRRAAPRGSDTPATVGAEPAPRARSRARRPAPASSDTAAAATSEGNGSSSSSGAPPASAGDASADGEEPRGIWQRLISGRKS